MYDARLDKLADVLTGYSLGVRAGDSVLIKAPVLAEPLILALARRVLKAGGNPVVRCAPEGIEELTCKLGKGKQLAFVATSDKVDLETVNCYIGIWASGNTRAMSNVGPKKQQARSLARKSLMDIFIKRSAAKGAKKLRWTGTQFPCPASAQDAEMSLSEYADFVFAAGMLHLPNPAAAWRRVHTAQKRMCDFLDKSRQVRFVSAGGTDLTVGVAGRRWINCDGTQNFPDGEVFTGPIEDATEGVAKYDFPAMAGGREVTDVCLRFKRGRVVDASASKNEDYLFKMMDQDRGSRVLGEVAIGTNYSIKRYTRNTLFDEKIGGTFHAALGASFPESGGKNESALHWDMVCDLRRGGRIEVDGKVVARNGRFLNRSWPQSGRAR